MVASDTVVGLIGAGVLVVALIGVFVYESNGTGSGSGSLVNSKYPATTDGVALLTQQNPPQVPGQACMPPVCTPARTQVTLNVTGLPAAHEASYVVFLDTGGAAGRYFRVGKLDPSGNKHAINYNAAGDHSASKTLVVSLEARGEAASPGFAILSYALTSPGRTTLDKPSNATVDFMGPTGQHTLTFTAAGGGTNVTAHLVDVPARSGLTYRGWMVKQDGTGLSYTFVGNFTPDSTQASVNTTGGAKVRGNGTIARDVPGSSNSYESFVVTLDPSSSRIGTQPAGPVVVRSDYNKPAPIIPSR